jgi:hypothetical protein
MKRPIHRILFLAIFLLITADTFAQSDAAIFAVTDRQQEGKSWLTLRRIDPLTGDFGTLMFDGGDKSQPIYDLKGGKFINHVPSKISNLDPEVPFGTGVAAIAYDRKSNRLFYVPMYYPQLRYIDLNTNRVFTSGNMFQGSGNTFESLTRMVIGNDGFGYALSTDGNHLYQFNTSGTPVIKDLGPLKDASGNKEMAIVNNSCMTSGGDLVADDDNNLYLIAARLQVFRISTKDRVATYIGNVKGLPKGFMANGAAVDPDGMIVLSNSVNKAFLYRVDPSNWEAVDITAAQGAYNAADLASSNVLLTHKTKAGPALVRGNIKIFPNPVRSNSFQVKMANMENGIYHLLLTDISGRTVMEKKINVNSGGFLETIMLPGSFTKGIYMVRIINERSKQVTVEKVLVERLR